MKRWIGVIVALGLLASGAAATAMPRGEPATATPYIAFNGQGATVKEAAGAVETQIVEYLEATGLTRLPRTVTLTVVCMEQGPDLLEVSFSGTITLHAATTR
jgi:hypothetical protein